MFSWKKIIKILNFIKLGIRDNKEKSLTWPLSCHRWLTASKECDQKDVSTTTCFHISLPKMASYQSNNSTVDWSNLRLQIFWLIFPLGLFICCHFLSWENSAKTRALNSTAEKPRQNKSKQSLKKFDGNLSIPENRIKRNEKWWVSTAHLTVFHFLDKNVRRTLPLAET